MLWLYFIIISVNAKVDDDIYSGESAIIKELKRSMSAYPERQTANAVEDYLRHLLDERYSSSPDSLSNASCREEIIMILNRKVVVFRNKFIHGKKREKHAHMILSAIDMTEDAVEHFPNVIYRFDQASAGDAGESMKERQIPRVVISKKFGYSSPGILMPNPYFGFGDLRSWQVQTHEFISNMSNQLEWKERDPRVFWRGDISQHPVCERDDGNYARLQAVSLTYEQPEFFDIRCRKCRPHNISQSHERFTDRNCIMKWSTDANPTFAILTASPDSIKQVQDGVFHGKEDYARYRGLLNLPGKTYGSYSRNLNELWALGAVVFIWADSVVEFYYPALEAGRTHLLIDKANAHETVSVLNSAESSNALIRGARSVAERIVCATCLARYISVFCKIFYRHFGLGLILDDSKRLGMILEDSGIDCSMDLVELRISPKHKALVEVDFPPSASCVAILRDYLQIS